MLKKVLTIAGSDCSGGAGIQADLKTMLAQDVYGMSVITALTAQNTCGVRGVEYIGGSFIKAQLQAVMEDIRPDAIKIGMVGGLEQIGAIVEVLKDYPQIPMVVDPVMVSTSGCKLLPDEAGDYLVNKLFPLATVITPNLPEGELLYGQSINSPQEMKQAGKILQEKYKVNVLLKGGHLAEEALDVLAMEGEIILYPQAKIHNPNTHGTGCSLSSAIACYLAKGANLAQAVQGAKDYITKVLASDFNLGAGSGPLDHGYPLRRVRNGS